MLISKFLQFYEVDILIRDMNFTDILGTYI